MNNEWENLAMKSYIIHPAPFPLPFDVVDNWSNIIRNNKFYYVEGVEPGNIIPSQ